MIVYKGKLLKNNSDQKSKLVLSTLVTAWLSIHLWPILLQTLVAIKLESCQTSFPSFCTQPSEVAVLFNLNLSRRPFLGQVVNLNLLLSVLCTGFNLEHAVLFQCHISSQRPMTDRKMERSNGRGFGLQQLFTYSIKNLISCEEKNWRVRVVAAWKLQIIKKLLTLELSQYRESNGTFFSSKPVSASSVCSRLRNTLCLCASLTRPSCAWALPQELGFWFFSQNLWLSSGIAFGSDCQMTCRGLNLDYHFYLSSKTLALELTLQAGLF